MSKRNGKGPQGKEQVANKFYKVPAKKPAMLKAYKVFNVHIEPKAWGSSSVAVANPN